VSGLRDHAVVVGGLRMIYRTAGEPAAPPVVLLHALGETSAHWDRVLADLGTSHRVHAPDLRGHGRTDWSGVYSLEQMRDDVTGLLDALGIDRVAVIGHSMGAVVAYLLAEQHPDRVAALVLEEPAPPLPAVPERAVPPRPDGPLSFDWAVVRPLTAQRNRPDPLWWDRLTRITAPTLVIAGGPGSHLPQAQIEELAARIPNAELVVVNGGHDVHTSCPRQFIGAVSRFLDRADPW
jgi:3-oxoadipate enol-lactonase